MFGEISAPGARQPTRRPRGGNLPRGRWYATGLDSGSGEVRSFRLDRVARAVVQEGQFPVPDGFDPGAHVLEAVSGASYRHAISVRVQGSERAARLASWAEAR